MRFAKHAYERYRQFHMLDRPTATDEDARDVLERFGPAAVLTKAKTHRGDPVWLIEELGVELVAKHENGVVTCVTVLPPPEFRGLTPLQAERVADAADDVRRRADEALRAAAALQLAARENRKATAIVRSMPTAKLQTQISDAKAEANRVCAERDILVVALKVMRHQLNREENDVKMKSVIRTAVRRMLAVGDEDGLAEIAALEPAFVSDRFLERGEE